MLSPGKLNLLRFVPGPQEGVVHIFSKSVGVRVLGTNSTFDSMEPYLKMLWPCEDCLALFLKRFRSDLINENYKRINKYINVLYSILPLLCN